ncbi:LysR family transcriptional regulator [Iodobacter ciconiae]|uniref:LysR family transcriptional regulator n=1 Tax=Iodobacter ciconiae TaxID=2496266 RepID=A0A3S8ZSW3_9NEIS|nr:LysR family transcriptional regulator [Iodobacter ciconiae]AZN36515.1 LysR family transcriptional regulator [Iodobacter ciconiae]
MKNSLLSINFKNLEVLSVTVDTLSFTQTANLLNTSPSAISKQIQKLESILNMKLFIRNDNEKLCLTKEGLEVYSHVIPLLSHMEFLENSIIDIHSSLTIKIGVNISSFLNFPKDILHYLDDENIKFKIFQYESKTIAKLLSENKLDIGIHCLESVPKCETKKFKDLSLALYTPIHHPLSIHSSLYLKEALNYKFATFTEDSFIYKLIYDEAKANNIKLKVIALSMDSNLIFQAIKNKIAIGVLPISYVFSAPDEIVSIPLNDEWAQRDLYISVSAHANSDEKIIKIYNKFAEFDDNPSLGA